MSEPGTGNRTPTEQQPERDRTPTGVPIAAAATRLGVSTDAIRARIRRGTLEGVKQGGVWFVTLPDDDDDPPDTDQTQPDTDRERIEDLKAEISFLRERLEDRDRQLDNAINQAASERERADVLQREALQRLEALTPGGDDRQRATHEVVESPETNATGTDRESAEAQTATPQMSVLARLWRALRGDN